MDREEIKEIRREADQQVKEQWEKTEKARIDLKIHRERSASHRLIAWLWTWSVIVALFLGIWFCSFGKIYSQLDAAGRKTIYYQVNLFGYVRVIK